MNDIWIERDNGATFKIPLTYGPREKFLARIQQDPILKRNTALTLPRIGFEITSVNYDGDRKLGTLIKNVKRGTANNSSQSQYQAVPYNIGFEVGVYGKTAEEATQIIEQILPFFTPQWNIRAKIDLPYDTVYTVPVILNNVSQSDSYDDAFTERRAVVWTLDFTMKTFMFGPVSNSAIIKISDVNLIAVSNADLFSNTAQMTQIYITETENINLQPGLTDTGEPTTDQDESIDPLLINYEDDWGYAARITSIEDE